MIKQRQGPRSRFLLPRHTITLNPNPESRQSWERAPKQGLGTEGTADRQTAVESKCGGNEGRPVRVRQTDGRGRTCGGHEGRRIHGRARQNLEP
jgi:hypothetical protein